MNAKKKAYIADIFNIAKQSKKLKYVDKELLKKIINKKYANKPLSMLIFVKCTFEQKVAGEKLNKLEEKEEKEKVLGTLDEMLSTL